MELRKKACGACRARKIRCSRQIPRCAACRRSNLDCKAQETSNDLIWLSRQDNGDRQDAHSTGNVLRRHCIFSDEQRVHECGILLNQVAEQNIDSILSQVDEASQGLRGRSASVKVGPFGAFHAPASYSLPESPSTPAASRSDTNATLQPSDLGSILSSTLYPNGEDLLSSSNSAPDNWGDLGDLFEPLSPQWPTYPFFEDLVGLPGATLSDINQNEIEGESEEAVQHPDDSKPEGESSHAAGLVNATFLKEPSQLEIVLDGTMSLSINQVQLLLRNYEMDLVNSLTPLKHDKPPWVLLHLKCALAAFSDLYMMGRSNDARVSVLLSVLSTSAYHLHHKLAAIPGAGEDLAVLGSQCFRLAKKRLQACLQKRSGTTKVAKYKEMLMAFLNLVTACVFAGEMQEARYFLLDAGRLINAYGIQKAQKSKKVIILHAMYVYMRVFEECAHPSSNIRNPCNPMDAGSGNEAGRYSSMWKHDPRKDLPFPQGDKPAPETSTSILPHDIEVASMLEKIYGIPQNLFHLVWQTTALGNEVAELRYTSGLTPQMSLRIKELDDTIMSFENPHLLKGQGQGQDAPSSTSSRQGGEEEVERRTALLFDLTEALHSALIIYFYRHVCDMGLLVLQHYVEKTAKSLFRYESQKQEYGDTSPGICWPAFIAGCETNSVELREELSIWLLNNAQSSGIGMFSTAHDLVVEVWRAREVPGCENLHWKSVVANHDTRLVLT
ncbi:fungal-specific transcription factor domain-containing protein [Ilyonectria robusta]|uniref:fungal-specific transcription factor domain-containing protein n=1 Tax=Ilyonectria robusta TaxID=1079257 RepID=UPI001E8EBD0D|nr:fungal-specific transcription factor domain-containing protein [Ilyonectria robusta]KAH8683624.1 fungal-specific transcription factor domain-containing protein [Ilyonectria robusta]